MAQRKYWSHRKGHRTELNDEFWAAFDASLQRMIIAAGDFRGVSSFFGELISHIRGINYQWLDEDLRNAVQEKIGRNYYSPFYEYKRIPPNDDHVFDLLEVLYDLTKREHKDQYSSTVNALLKRLNQPYELVGGEVHYRGSEVLDEPVENLDGMAVRDEALRGYLVQAREAFFDAREDRRLEGLRALYDAFERVKTLHDVDKKESSKRIIADLSQSEEIQQHLDALFRIYTAIGNKTNIRHSERDKVLLDNSPELVEQLFYSVWALIRAVLATSSSDKESS